MMAFRWAPNQKMKRNRRYFDIWVTPTPTRTRTQPKPWSKVSSFHHYNTWKNTKKTPWLWDVLARWGRSKHFSYGRRKMQVNCTHKESLLSNSTKFQWLFTWRTHPFDPPSTVFCFLCLLCSAAIFTLHSMHPFCPLSSLCSRPNPLIPTSSLADTLTTNPPNPAKSWRKSQHLQPCCLQLCLLSHWCHRNLQTKHGCESLQPCRLTLSLPLHSILPALSCPSSCLLDIILKVWHWVFKTTCCGC